MAKKAVGHIANLPPVDQIGAFLRWIALRKHSHAPQRSRSLFHIDCLLEFGKKFLMVLGEISHDAGVTQ